MAGKRKGRDLAFHKAIGNILWSLFVLGQNQTINNPKMDPFTL